MTRRNDVTKKGKDREEKDTRLCRRFGNKKRMRKKVRNESC